MIQLWFNYFEVSFYKALGVHFSRKAKDRDASVVGAFTPVSLSVYRDDQFANLSVPFQNAVQFLFSMVGEEKLILIR